MLVRGDEAKGDGIIRRPLQLAARKHPGDVAVHQDAQQKRQVVRERPQVGGGGNTVSRPSHGSTRPLSRKRAYIDRSCRQNRQDLEPIIPRYRRGGRQRGRPGADGARGCLMQGWGRFWAGPELRTRSGSIKPGRTWRSQPRLRHRSPSSAEERSAQADRTDLYPDSALQRFNKVHTGSGHRRQRR